MPGIVERTRQMDKCLPLGSVGERYQALVWKHRKAMKVDIKVEPFGLQIKADLLCYGSHCRKESDGGRRNMTALPLCILSWAD